MSDGPPRPMPAGPLRRLLQSSLPSTGAQSDREIEPSKFYIPARHIDAVRLDRPVVLGMRGAGKSAWWAALQNTAIRGLLAQIDPRLGISGETSVSSGFGAVPSPEHYPARETLARWIDGNVEPRAVWRTVVAHHTFAPTLPEIAGARSWDDRLRWTTDHPDAFNAALDAFQRERATRRAPHLLLFDALELTADAPSARRKLLRGLLQVTLELLTYRGVRTKVFARQDMFDEALDFPDASKLVAAKVELKWEARDLFPLLFQYLSNDPAPESGVFREHVAKLLRREWSRQGKMWIMPLALRESDDLQLRVLHSITGPWMGHNHRRGLPWSWLPRHLADAWQRVSPRHFLVALRAAADESPRPDWPYPLHFDDIKAGVREASKIRVKEIEEDIPWVKAAIGPMSGLALPTEEADILRRLRAPELLGVLRDMLGDAAVTSHTVLQRLIALGIVERMTDGRINMPDVYRVGFGLRLKGGIAPQR